jgi:hypothetical protein
MVPVICCALAAVCTPPPPIPQNSVILFPESGVRDMEVKLTKISLKDGAAIMQVKWCQAPGDAHFIVVASMQGLQVLVQQSPAAVGGGGGGGVSPPPPPTPLTPPPPAPPPHARDHPCCLLHDLQRVWTGVLVVGACVGCQVWDSTGRSMLLYHSAPGRVGLTSRPLTCRVVRPISHWRTTLLLQPALTHDSPCAAQCPPTPFAARPLPVGVFCRGIAASADVGKIFVGGCRRRGVLHIPRHCHTPCPLVQSANECIAWCSEPLSLDAPSLHRPPRTPLSPPQAPLPAGLSWSTRGRPP